MECRWQVENDPFANKVLAKHWPNIPRYGDIREVKGAELERVDCIAGGFPCQDLSQAGKRVGIEGARSGLWFEFVRLVGELRPCYVLIENVPGLLVPGAMSRVVGELARLGYVGCWLSLRASDFGASHLRKRIFIVAYSVRTGSPSERPGESDPERGADPIGASGSIAGAELADSAGGRFGIVREPSGRDGFVNGSHAQLENAARDEQPGLPRQDRGMRRRGVCEPSEQLADSSNGQLQEQRWGSEGRTGIGSAGTFAPGPADPRWPAILSERPDLAPALESPLRGVVDGVPDTLDGTAMKDRTKRLGRLGNAVVPDCAEWIGRRILSHSASNSSALTPTVKT